MPPPRTQTAPDVWRAVWCLFGMAFFCAVLAGMYRNAYFFEDPFGVTLPDVSVSADHLVAGFQASAVLSVVWALLLAAVGTPPSARSMLAGWHRRVAAEAARPRALLVAGALSAGYAALRLWANIETGHATLEAFTEGTAKTPFQYRALVPWLARGVHGVMPGLGLPAVYGVLEAVAALAVYLAFRSFLRAFVVDATTRRLAALAVFVPLALNYATPYRYNAVFFPYDTASVAFFTGGLALMLRREWWVYYPLFVVATLNRETTCFLTVAYVCVALGRERLPVIAGHVAAQAVLWVGIKTGLGALYADNVVLSLGSTGLFSNQLARSGRILTAVPGLTYLALMTMGGAAVVASLLRRRIGDGRLLRLFGVVPPFFLGMIIVGELLEVRIYGELIPLVTAALLLAFAAVARETGAALPAPASGDTASTGDTAPGARSELPGLTVSSPSAADAAV